MLITAVYGVNALDKLNTIAVALLFIVTIVGIIIAVNKYGTGSLNVDPEKITMSSFYSFCGYSCSVSSARPGSLQVWPVINSGSFARSGSMCDLLLKYGYRNPTGFRQWVVHQLYSRYYESLMVIACSYTHNRHTAEDLVQNAFLKAILSYKPSGSFLSWANRVIRNDFLNSIRMEKYRAENEPETTDLADCYDLLESLIHNEKKARLAAMIASLPLRQRTIMIESVYLELGDEQIAKAHAITEANVRQIRSRAKKALIKMMENEEDANE